MSAPPRSYFHEPPDWLWWLVVRWRWLGHMIFRVVEKMPGVCHAHAVDWIVNPTDGCKPTSMSAAGCLRDVACNGSCWCGKYRGLEEIEAELAHPLHIRDPWHGLTFELVGDEE